MQCEYASKKKALTKTAAYTVQRSDSGAAFNNNGASGSVTFTLPTNASPDDVFEFFVATAQNMVIDPGAAGIFVRGTNTTAAQVLTNGTVGGYLQIQCIAANKWAVLRTNGTWTAS